MKYSAVLIFVILIIFSSFAAAEINFTNSAYTENFNYTDLFTNHGYQFLIGGYGLENKTPVNNAFGINGTNNAGFGYTNGIRANFLEKPGNTNITVTEANTLLLKYKFLHGNSSEEQTAFLIDLKSYNSAITFIEISHSYTGLAGNRTIIDMGRLGGRNCSFFYDRQVWNEMYIYFDFAAHTYTAKLNGFSMCSDYNTGTAALNLSSITLIHGVDALAVPQRHLLDDLIINLSKQTAEAVYTADASHVLFCDNFNYGTPLYSTKGWLVLNPGLSIDTTLTPADNRLALLGFVSKSPSHNTGAYSYSYQLGANLFMVSSMFAPVFSSEMNINITSAYNDTTASCFRYEAMNGADFPVYDILLCPNRSAYYYDTSYHGLCNNCVPYNTDFNFKVITYFSQKPGMPFNSSVSQDKISVFINNSQYDILPTWDERVTRISQYKIAKNSDASFYVDDYCVYVGTDKNINNLDYFYVDSYVPSNETIIAGTESGDLVTNIQSLYDTLGMQSLASKIFVGLLILAVCNILLLLAFGSYGINVGAMPYILLNIVGVIGLVYIGLIPIWIVILLGILMAGGLVVIIGKAISGGD